MIIGEVMHNRLCNGARSKWVWKGFLFLFLLVSPSLSSFEEWDELLEDTPEFIDLFDEELVQETSESVVVEVQEFTELVQDDTEVFDSVTLPVESLISSVEEPLEESILFEETVLVDEVVSEKPSKEELDISFEESSEEQIQEELSNESLFVPEATFEVAEALLDLEVSSDSDFFSVDIEEPFADNLVSSAEDLLDEEVLSISLEEVSDLSAVEELVVEEFNLDSNDVSDSEFVSIDVDTSNEFIELDSDLPIFQELNGDSIDVEDVFTDSLISSVDEPVIEKVELVETGSIQDLPAEEIFPSEDVNLPEVITIDESGTIESIVFLEDELEEVAESVADTSVQDLLSDMDSVEDVDTKLSSEDTQQTDDEWMFSDDEEQLAKEDEKVDEVVTGGLFLVEETSSSEVEELPLAEGIEESSGTKEILDQSIDISSTSEHMEIEPTLEINPLIIEDNSIAEAELVEEKEGLLIGGETIETQEELKPYFLRVGDALRISMYGEMNSERVVSVDPHGSITYPLAGRVLAAGLTISQLKERLNELIKQEYKFAMINVVPVYFGGQHFTILGMVYQPGKKDIQGKVRLLDAISSGGGFVTGTFRSGTIDLVDLEHSFVARDGDLVPTDFSALVRGGDMTHNIEILPDDYIFLPNAMIRDIYVLGAVLSPSSFGYSSQSTLINAIALARGLDVDANPNVCIVRGSLNSPEKYVINIQDILNGIQPDVLLQPGDIVYVPRRKFLEIEELVRLAIRSFIGANAAEAGSRTYESINPKAKDDDDRSGLDTLF